MPHGRRHQLGAASRDPSLTLRRVERQQLIIEVLAGARTAMTATALADRLGVAVRTVERDVARLRESGVPLETRPGPYGGVRLTTGSNALPVTFDLSEVAALLASLAAVGPTSTDSARSARDKLVAALTVPDD